MLSLLSYSPAISPIEPDDLYRHIRLVSMNDTESADMALLAATEMVENFLSRLLITRQVTWTVANDYSNNHLNYVRHYNLPWQFDSFFINRSIELPMPASSIDSVKIGIWGQDDVTLVDGTDYQTDLTTELGRIRWISSAHRNLNKDHLQVTFHSGYGDDATSIPQPILYAIKLLAANLYENRGDQMPDVMSSAVMNLLGCYRLYSFGT